MTRSLVGRLVRGASLGTLIAACIALGGGDALAAHAIGSSGTPGAWSWTDSAAHPAGICDYTGGGAAGHTYMTHLKVKAPATVFWPAGTGSSSGKVGFKVTLQHLTAGVWVNVTTGSEAIATAKRHTSAMFGTRGVPRAGPLTGRFRGLAILTWYTPSMAVLGRVRVVIDHYSNNHDSIGRSYCPAVYSNF